MIWFFFYIPALIRLWQRSGTTEHAQGATCRVAFLSANLVSMKLTPEGSDKSNKRIIKEKLNFASISSGLRANRLRRPDLHPCWMLLLSGFWTWTSSCLLPVTAVMVGWVSEVIFTHTWDIYTAAPVSCFPRLVLRYTQFFLFLLRSNVHLAKDRRKYEGLHVNTQSEWV